MSNLQHCLPDCEETLYSAKVSAAPFHRCDFRTIQVNPLCNLATTEDSGTVLMMGTAPIWGASVIEQYRKVIFAQIFLSYIGQHLSLLLYRGTENGVPPYVMDKVADNRRKFATTNRVSL